MSQSDITPGSAYHFFTDRLYYRGEVHEVTDRHYVLLNAYLVFNTGALQEYFDNGFALEEEAVPGGRSLYLAIDQVVAVIPWEEPT